MRPTVDPLRVGVVLLLMLLMPATVSADERFDAAVRQLRSAGHAQRDGSHVTRLLALRQLRDPAMRPMFERLVGSEAWEVQVHAILGLAELGVPPAIDPALVARADPRGQEVLVATAIDLDLLGPDQLDALLQVETLPPMSRLLLLGERILAGGDVDTAALERLAAGEDERFAPLAALLLARVGDPASLNAQAAGIDVRPGGDPARAVWLLEAIRQYQVDTARPIVERWLETPDVHEDVAYWSVYTMIALDVEEGLRWWTRRLRPDLTDRERVGYALLLLASEAAVPPSVYDQLASEHELLRSLASAGRALASGGDAAPALIEIIDFPHPRSTAWLMDRLVSLPDEQATAVYVHIIESLNLESWRRAERLALATVAVTRLFERQPDLVTARLETVEDDGLAQEVILLGLVESSSPAAGEAARRVRRIGASRPDSLALLTIARHASRLDEPDLQQLGMVAAGGGFLSEEHRVRAAWLYVRHLGAVDRALEEVFVTGVAATVTDAIPLSLPDIGDEEVRLVVATLRSGRLSLGPRLVEFERLVAARTRRTHAVGVSSGTAGLHLALAALGIGPGDEVITPAFSFVASANCVLYAGATPVFVDCDPRTLNLRAKDVERRITSKTKAIIAVEIFGNPAGLPELAALSTKHEIPLIEDACEGLGGRLGRDAVGSFGRVAVFGFYPNKQITTGEGGMIVTDDDRLADLCRSMRNHGRAADNAESGSGLGSWLEHERLGYNYRLDEISAALGVAQMRRLEELVEARQMVAAAYTRRLMGNPDIIVPTVESETYMSWFVYVARLSDRFTADDRDEIIEGLRRHDVGASNYFPPIPLLPHYRRRFGHQLGEFPAAESVSHRTIALPFFTRLTEREVDLVCQTLELMMKRVTFARR